jgi:hypothetical protein
MNNDFLKGFGLALASSVVVVIAFQFFSSPSNDFGSPAAGRPRMEALPGKGNPDVDPYIKGPVKNTIVKKFKEIKECYQEFSKTQPKASGRMKLDWQIDLNGVATKVELVSSDFNDANFETCILSKVKTFAFPTPPEPNYYVEHSFHFRPEGEELPRPEMVTDPNFGAKAKSN